MLLAASAGQSIPNGITTCRSGWRKAEYKRAFDKNQGVVAGAPLGGLVEQDTSDKYGLARALLKPLLPWLRRVNTRWKGERDILVSRTFPFLDHFLVDAEAFWATGEPGRIGSGLSSEPGADGKDFHFEAWAVTVESGQFLLLEWRRDELMRLSRTKSVDCLELTMMRSRPSPTTRELSDSSTSNQH